MKTFSRLAVHVGMLLRNTAATRQQQHVTVDPYGLGFRIAWTDDEGQYAGGEQENLTVAVSELTERDADGAAVGLRESVPHRFVATGNNSVSTTGDTLVYLEGNAAMKMSASTIILGGSTSATLTAYRYLAAGNTTAFEPSTTIEVNNWPFCTPFGWFGGVTCPADAQDILLELPGALPEPPTPPPPHTLLLPRCNGDHVATLRFVCDPKLRECLNLGAIKFYLGEADQAVNRAPNLATITSNSTDGMETLKIGKETGWYEHNVTRDELGGFLNISELTPGLDYVFWSVWGQEYGSNVEFNTREFDLNRTQYWQCPGTTISRNFETGNSLSASFTVKGSSPTMIAVCDDHSSMPSPATTTANSYDTNNGNADSDPAVPSTSRNHSRARLRRLHSPNNWSQAAEATRRALGNTEAFCVHDDDDRSNERTEWAWGGATGGASFAPGVRSRIRFSSGARLDGDWFPLPEGTSTANDEGQVVAVVDKFRSRVVYSMLLYLADEAEVLDESSLNRERDDKTAMWVAIAFSGLILWVLGCCALHQTEGSHAARTWPAAIARAQARARGIIKDDDDDTANSNFGTPDEPHSHASVRANKNKEKRPRTPVATTPTPGSSRAKTLFNSDPLSPFHFSDASRLTAWATPVGVTGQVESSTSASTPARDARIGTRGMASAEDTFSRVGIEAEWGMVRDVLRGEGAGPRGGLPALAALENQEVDAEGGELGVRDVQVIEI